MDNRTRNSSSLPRPPAHPPPPPPRPPSQPSRRQSSATAVSRDATDNPEVVTEVPRPRSSENSATSNVSSRNAQVTGPTQGTGKLPKAKRPNLLPIPGTSASTATKRRSGIEGKAKRTSKMQSARPPPIAPKPKHVPIAAPQRTVFSPSRLRARAPVRRKDKFANMPAALHEPLLPPQHSSAPLPLATRPSSPNFHRPTKALSLSSPRTHTSSAAVRGRGRCPEPKKKKKVSTQGAGSRVVLPGYKLLRSVSESGDDSPSVGVSGGRDDDTDFTPTFPKPIQPMVPKRVEVPDPAASLAGHPGEEAGDESRTESDSPTISCDVVGVQDDNVQRNQSAPAIGKCGYVLCILYALLLTGSALSIVLRSLLSFDCWFKVEASLKVCRSEKTAFSPLAVPISIGSLVCWLTNYSIFLFLLARRSAWFDRPMKSRRWLRSLHKQHHIWLLVVLTIGAFTFDLMETKIKKYRRFRQLPWNWGDVTSSMWVMEKVLMLVLVCQLNYRPQLKSSSSLVVRLLYKATLLVLTVLQFASFLHNTMFVTLKVMPDAEGLKYDSAISQQASKQEIRRLLAFLLLVVNCVFRFHMASFLSAKIFYPNQNLFHPVHADVFRQYRSVSQYLSDSDIYDHSVGQSSTFESRATGRTPRTDDYSPAYYDSHTVAPEI